MKKTNIVRSLAIVLSLGVAPGIAFAQGDMTKKPEGQSQSTTSGGGQGESSSHSMKTGQADAGQKVQNGSSMQSDSGSSTQNAQEEQGSSSKSAQDESGSAKHKHSKHAKGENGNSMKNAKGESGSSTENAKGETNSHNKNAQGENNSMQKNAQGQKGNENGKNAKNRSGQTGNMNASGQSTSNEKTSSIHVNVSDHQRTEIRQVITKTHVEPVRQPSFSISVGTAVPHKVHLHTLPPRVVEIVPEYQDYEYFMLADGRIVIVDPDTLDIVYILPA